MLVVPSQNATASFRPADASDAPMDGGGTGAGGAGGRVDGCLGGPRTGRVGPATAVRT